MTLIVVAFIALFVLTVASIHFGTRYLEGRRKKRIAEMLQGTADVPAVTTKLLKDQLNPGDNTYLEQLFKSLNFVRKAEDMIQQSGISWTTARLFRTMAVMALPGMLVSLFFPVVLNAPVT